MNKEYIYVVFDEGTPISSFNKEEDAYSYAKAEAYKQASREIQENMASPEEPDPEDIWEWMIKRGTHHVKEMTNEKYEELLNEDNYLMGE